MESKSEPSLDQMNTPPVPSSTDISIPPNTQTPPFIKKPRRKARFIAFFLAFLILLASIAIVVYLNRYQTKFASNNTKPDQSSTVFSPSQPPQPTTQPQPASSPDEMRLQLINTSVYSSSQAIQVNVDSQEGILQIHPDPARHSIKSLISQPHQLAGDYQTNETVTIGSLQPFFINPDFSIINPATLFNQRLYFFYRDQQQIGIASIDTASYISQPLNTDQLPPAQYQSLEKYYPNISLHPALTPSPNGQYLAAVLSGSKLPPYASSLVVTDINLSDPQIAYYEHQTAKPSIFNKTEGFKLEELWPVMHLKGWSSDNQHLYVNWLMEGTSNSTASSMAKISINGQTELITSGATDTVIAMSPDEQLLFTATSSFGLIEPGVYNLTTQSYQPIDMNTLVETARQQIGPAGETYGRAEGLTTVAYFSADNQTLYFTIHYSIPDDSVIKWYQVDLSQSPLQPQEIDSPPPQQ